MNGWAWTDDDVLDLLRAVDRSDIREMSVECGALRVSYHRGGIAGSAPAGGPGASGAVPRSNAGGPGDGPASGVPLPSVDTAQGETGVRGAGTLVRAPLLGTLRRSPVGGTAPFVRVGDTVSSDDTVCLIEVLHDAHRVLAGASGRVARWLAEDGALVEYQQPLVILAPA